MKGLEGKTAIVTGGSSGIGQAIAIRLGHEGVNVAVNYVGPMEGAQSTKDAIDAGVHACIDEVNACSAPSRAILVEADVFSPGAAVNPYAANLMENISKRMLRIDRIVPIHGTIVPFAEFQKAVSGGARTTN